MVASATLQVDSNIEMSPSCVRRTMMNISSNLQDLTDTLKQECSNPEMFDLSFDEPAVNYTEESSEAGAQNKDKKVTKY